MMKQAYDLQRIVVAHNRTTARTTCRCLVAFALSATLGGCAVLSELAQDPAFMSELQRQTATYQAQKLASSPSSTYRAPIYVPPMAAAQVYRPTTPVSSPSAYQVASVQRQTIAAVPNCLKLQDRKLVNVCSHDVEATWCVASNGNSCTRYDNSWTIRAGNSYSVGSGHVYWNACRGANTIARRDGLSVTCYQP